MDCYAMLCCAMLCCAVLCAGQCHAWLCCSALGWCLPNGLLLLSCCFDAAYCSAVLIACLLATVRRCAVMCCAALVCSALLCCAVLLLCSAVLPKCAALLYLVFWCRWYHFALLRYASLGILLACRMYGSSLFLSGSSKWIKIVKIAKKYIFCSLQKCLKNRSFLRHQAKSKNNKLFFKGKLQVPFE